jgi:hypothetical protein
MTSLAATVEALIDAPREQAFSTIASIDLTSIFTGYGPLPAVTGVFDQVGGWDTAGQTRSVALSDGSSASEGLTQYRYPEHFSYTLSGFTDVLRFLTTAALGEWWFEPVSEARTRIRWRYAFVARNVAALPLLWLTTNVLWRGYMKRALSLATCQIRPYSAQQPSAHDHLSAGSRMAADGQRRLTDSGSDE